MRNEIIMELVNKFKQLTVDNGFNYNQDPELVFDWLDRRIEESDERPVIEIRDERGDADQTRGFSSHIIEIHISIYKSGVIQRGEIRGKMADILEAVRQWATSTTLQIDNMDYRGDDTIFQTINKSLGAIDMVFDCYYKTDKWQI